MCDGVLLRTNVAEHPSLWARRVFRVIKDVRNYFLLIIERRTTDAMLMQTAYDVASILANVPLGRPNREIGSLELIRIINVVMSKLTTAGMHYCTFNYPLCLLRSYREWYNPADTTSMSRIIHRFFQTNIGHLSEGDLDESGRASKMDSDYLNVSQLYNKYVNASSVVNAYTPYVLFKWRGRDCTIKDVFENVINFPFNPRFVFAVYDICFKFFIAVVYYKIWEMQVSENQQTAYKIITERYILNYSNFPLALELLISEINTLLAFYGLSSVDNAWVPHQNSVNFLMELFNVTVRNPRDDALVQDQLNSCDSSSTSNDFMEEQSTLLTPLNSLLKNITTAILILRFHWKVRGYGGP